MMEGNIVVIGGFVKPTVDADFAAWRNFLFAKYAVSVDFSVVLEGSRVGVAPTDGGYSFWVGIPVDEMPTSLTHYGS